MEDNASTSNVTDASADKDHDELRALMKTLRHDPTLWGVFSIGKDGVMRSLTADREVVDAIPLSPRLIKAHIDGVPYDQKSKDEFLELLKDGLDGTKVPREKWFNPDKGLLPPAPAEETKEKWRREREEKGPPNTHGLNVAPENWREERYKWRA